jgi:hypothetical protein
MAWSPSPTPGHWPVALGWCFKMWQENEMVLGHTKMIFLFSQNWTKFVNYENHLYVAPKFFKNFNRIQWKIMNKFPFGWKFKFKTEFELKFLEEKLLLNLNWIYWGSNMFETNLLNSLKFFFALAFQNMNLDFHGCMAKFVVSVQAPFDLVWN